MLKKTSAVVLNYIKYKETSIIAKIFTREIGLKSYIINGVRSKIGKNKIGFYQPMSLLDLVVYDKGNSGLQRISETKLAYASQQIPFDFRRTSISLFMAEVIGKSIFEDYQNESLFDFIHQSVLHLDSNRVNLAHFPSIFLINQAKYLGFAPADAKEFFLESMIQPFEIEELERVKYFVDDALRNGFSNSQKLSKANRQLMLDYLKYFYSRHMDQDLKWKTLDILRQISG